MTTPSKSNRETNDAEECGPTLPRRAAATEDLEAQLLFEYRNLSLPKTFRFVENRGRFWLAAYIVPAIFIFVGGSLWWISGRYGWGAGILTPKRLFISTLGLSTTSAIVLALVSISRGETNSFYASQPLISAALTIIFAVAWVFVIKN
jgi:hypothetical protein